MIDIPIADFLGASVLTLSALVLILLAAAVLQYVRHSGKSTEIQAATEQLQAQNFAALIDVQKRQHKLMRHLANKTNKVSAQADLIEKRTNTNIFVLRRVVRQLEALTKEHKAHNGNAAGINLLIHDIKTYIEGKQE